MLIFLIVACCVTIIICKLISTNAHKQALLIERRLYSTEILGEEPEQKKPKSPYSLKRDMGNDKKWGYCIMENNVRMTSRSGYYEIYHELSDAKELLWELEAVGGYAKTKF